MTYSSPTTPLLVRHHVNNQPVSPGWPTGVYHVNRLVHELPQPFLLHINSWHLEGCPSKVDVAAQLPQVGVPGSPGILRS